MPCGSARSSGTSLRRALGRGWVAGVAVALAVLTGCSVGPPEPEALPAGVEEHEVIRDEDGRIIGMHAGPEAAQAVDQEGNVRVTGIGTVADGTGEMVDLSEEPTAIDVGETPRWLVGLANANDQVANLVVVGESGAITMWTIDGQGAHPAALDVTSTDAEAPPVLVAADRRTTLVEAPAEASPFAPVAVLRDGLAWITAGGGLVLRDGAVRLDELDVLRDGWIASVDDEHVAVLVGPTDRYGHAVLGDGIEASEVVVVRTEDGAIRSRTRVDGVVEGLRVTAGTLAGHDGPVMAVTVSDDAGGADVVVLDLDGNEVASTGAIGTGNRWRHVIAVDASMGLVEVVTPHLGKELRRSWPDGDVLREVFSAPGTMSSHSIGSRVLDEARLVRIPDQRLVIGPTADRRSFQAIDVVTGEVVLSQPLGSAWAGNLAVIPLRSAPAIVAVGTEAGRVLVWHTRG